MSRTRILLAAAVVGVVLSHGSKGLALPVRPSPSRNPAIADLLVSRPECRGVLVDSVVRDLEGRATDPADDFERWRTRAKVMLETPLPIDCEHQAWRRLHPLPGPVAPAPDDLGLGAAPEPLAAIISANAPLASGVSSYQGEVSMAVNPANPSQIVAGANTQYLDSTAACQAPSPATTYGTQALYGSTDGGSTWHYSCAPWPASISGGVSSADAWFGSDPVVGWDIWGNAYAIYMLVSLDFTSMNSGSAIVVSRSTDSGQTWAYRGTIVNNITSALNDKELFASDFSFGQAHSHTGRGYVIWDRNNVERMAYSDDFVTWTIVTLDSGADRTATGYQIGGTIAVGPDGTVYAIWNRLFYDAAGTNQTAEVSVFSKSTDGGVTWTSPANMFGHRLFSFGPNKYITPQDQRGVNAFLSLDVDRNPSSPYLGRLYIAYTEYVSSSATETDIFELHSTDDGATWGGYYLVNDDGSSTFFQFFPWLSVDQSDGSVNVAFYDTRVSGPGREAQVYYARSSTGGVGFEPNIRLSAASASFANSGVNYSDENSSDNTSRNLNQYGDYMGVSAVNRRVHVVWTDSRQFYPTSGDSRLEDAATATVTNCTAPSGFATPAVDCAAGGGITVSWSAPVTWGTNATGGSYTVTRYASASCGGTGTVLTSGTPKLAYTDLTPAPGGTYSYRVTATNNCPGTALTPMSTVGGCTAAITLPASTITSASPICEGSFSGASVPSAGAGAGYVWSVSNGSIASGQGTASISFQAGTGTLMFVGVTVTRADGCSADGSKFITLSNDGAAPTVTPPGAVVVTQTVCQ